MGSRIHLKNRIHAMGLAAGKINNAKLELGWNLSKIGYGMMGFYALGC